MVAPSHVLRTIQYLIPVSLNPVSLIPVALNPTALNPISLPPHPVRKLLGLTPHKLLDTPIAQLAVPGIVAG